MLMTVRKKIFLFVLFGFAVLAIVLLSAGISDMELARSNFRAIAPQESGPEFLPSPQDILDEPASAANIAFSLVLLIALLISIVHFILSPEARKRVIQRFLRLFFIIFAVYVISTRLGSRLNLDNQAPEGDAQSTFPFTPFEEIASSFPPWASYLLSFMLLAACCRGSLVHLATLTQEGASLGSPGRGSAHSSPGAALGSGLQKHHYPLLL
jgi:hypothetical protein